MSLKVKIEKTDGTGIAYVLFNDHPVGRAVQDVDGYYYYWPNSNNGTLAAHDLRAIADALDEINKPWDVMVAQACSKIAATIYPEDVNEN